jgi:AraC family transcriptional regulator, regulatory protein of adaptative response / methylated-DNA-[protein]-cysteine methyltransferase
MELELKTMREAGQQMVDWRWNAVASKNRDLDGVFYFGVRTTGIFCRPSCSSRQPKRENVSFYPTADDARRAGFRACMRCKPLDASFAGPEAELIASALRLLRNEKAEIATVDELAAELNVSAGHLQKSFKNMIGISPKETMDMFRLENFKENVRDADVTTSLYESGFGSSRSLYEKAGERMGMTPATYKKGGAGVSINYTIADSPLGKLLVASTDKGICAVSFGENEGELKRELEQEFFAAEIAMDDAALKNAVDSILRGLNGERSILALPLDIRGTAFQMRVWSQLRKIPYGETRSYKEVAETIGDPKAVRAVARACATNPVALVTPCHRVVASDGKLAGYRWGIERKAKLLQGESKDGKA